MRCAGAAIPEFPGPTHASDSRGGGRDQPMRLIRSDRGAIAYDFDLKLTVSWDFDSERSYPAIVSRVLVPGDRLQRTRSFCALPPNAAAHSNVVESSTIEHQRREQRQLRSTSPKGLSTPYFCTCVYSCLLVYEVRLLQLLLRLRQEARNHGDDLAGTLLIHGVPATVHRFNARSESRSAKRREIGRCVAHQ